MISTNHSYCGLDCEFLKKHKSFYCCLYQVDLFAEYNYEETTIDVDRCKECKKNDL